MENIKISLVIVMQITKDTSNLNEWNVNNEGNLNEKK